MVRELADGYGVGAGAAFILLYPLPCFLKLFNSERQGHGDTSS
jgi:hypothetical protein